MSGLSVPGQVGGTATAAGETGGFTVIGVCGGFGYPHGNASAARITMVGRALQAAGIGFRLLHCGPSPMDLNSQAAGTHEGIPFEYMTSVRRPSNSVARVVVYLRAAVMVTIRLAGQWRYRRMRVVYLYIMDSPLALYIGLLCRLSGIPVVQELCEWFPADPDCRPFVRWFHSKMMFRLATGVLVISRFLEERVRAKRETVNPGLLSYRLPAVADTTRFAPPAAMRILKYPETPEFVYCGTWLNDIRFLIRALSHVKKSGQPSRLTLVGGSLNRYVTAILAEAESRGLAREDVVFTGWVDDHTLDSCYRRGTALLMPLWSDDRSIARIPNKMPEYLASGRPVIAGKVGDLTELLTDGENAYLARPGDEADFSAKMRAALADPEQASRIGAAGYRTCMANLDFRGHIEGLAGFFRACLKRRGRRLVGKRAFHIARNTACGTLALILIACGFVRRARARAFAPDAITALYFHKPNRKLFARVIEWLTKRGYNFVSDRDVVDFIRHGRTPPKGAVWLSFDDGCRELLTNVMPLARERAIPITIFIPSGIIGGDGLFPWVDRVTAPDRDAVTVEELKELAAYPNVTIGGHTVTHAVTAGLTQERAWVELSESRRTLEEWTGREVRCFAYPAGRSDGGEEQLLAALGYQLAATTENALILRKCNLLQAPRFAVADDIWLPEAICNIVGVWRPVVDPVIHLLQRIGLRPEEHHCCEPECKNKARKLTARPTGYSDVQAS